MPACSAVWFRFDTRSTKIKKFAERDIVPLSVWYNRISRANDGSHGWIWPKKGNFISMEKVTRQRLYTSSKCLLRLSIAVTPVTLSILMPAYAQEKSYTVTNGPNNLFSGSLDFPQFTSA